MTEYTDDIDLRWALSDVAAKRHHFMRTSDDKLVLLAERGWTQVNDSDVIVTDAGREALR